MRPDEDLDRCPRCKEDMWVGQKLCRICQSEEDLEDAACGDGNPFDDDYVEINHDSYS